MRRGSTSMRVRACGRGVAARASQRVLVVRGAEQPAVVDWAEHVDAERASRARSTNAAAPAPDTAAMRGRGREAEFDPAGPLRGRRAGRIGVEHGVEHRMLRLAGLHDQPPTPVAGAEHPRRPGQQGHRLLVGAIAGASSS